MLQADCITAALEFRTDHFCSLPIMIADQLRKVTTIVMLMNCICRSRGTVFAVASSSQLRNSGQKVQQMVSLYMQLHAWHVVVFSSRTSLLFCRGKHMWAPSA